MIHTDNCRNFNDIKKDNTLKLTGERFLPWMEGAEHHYEHLHRYAFASQFVKGKKVLDMACGEGYGSNILSREAEYVVGIDIDEKTVRHAHRKYDLPNLKYIIGSVLEVPIKGTKKFDVIICFEAIEHVEEHEKLLSEVKRLLSKEGIFIISTPNKKTYSEEPCCVNPFHKKEFYFDEFKNLLEKYFKNVIFFGQKIYVTSNIWSLLPCSCLYKEFVIDKKKNEFYFSETDKKNPKYFIAMASDKKLDQKIIINNYLLDVSNTLIRDMEIQNDDLEKQICILTNEINNKNKNIVELSNTIAELNNILQSMQQSIVWQLLMKYNRLVEHVMPQGTKRKKYYDDWLHWMRGVLKTEK